MYFDDILIYNKTEEEHLKHIQEVFHIFQDNQFFLNLKKCKFMTSELLFLEFVVGEQGIKIDKGKFQAIQNWKSPSTMTKLHSFHRLATFYKKFIQHFSTIVRPLID